MPGSEVGLPPTLHAHGTKLQNLHREICSSSSDQFVKTMLLDVCGTIVFWSGEQQPYHFEISVLGAQKKAITAVVGGLLEEALKDYVGVLQSDKK